MLKLVNPLILVDRSSDLGFATFVNIRSRLRKNARNFDRALVIASISLRRRGDEIRVTGPRTLSTRPEHRLPLHGGASTSSAPLPDTGFAL